MYGLYAKKRGRCREVAVRGGSAVLKITGTHSHRLCPVRLSEIGFFSVYLSGFVVCDERYKKLQFFVGLNWRGIFMNWKMSHCKSWTKCKRGGKFVCCNRSHCFKFWKQLATLENYTCKSFIKLSPGVSYIGIVFSGEEKKTCFFSKIRSQKSRQTNLKYYWLHNARNIRKL